MQNSLIVLNMLISFLGCFLAIDQLRNMTKETCLEARIKYVTLFTFFAFSFVSFVYTTISIVNVLLVVGVTIFVALDSKQRKTHGQRRS